MTAERDSLPSPPLSAAGMWRTRAIHTVHGRARQRASFYQLWNAAARALVYVWTQGELESSFLAKKHEGLCCFSPQEGVRGERSLQKEGRKETHFPLRNNHTLLHYCAHAHTRPSIFIPPPPAHKNFKNACIIRQIVALVGKTSTPWKPTPIILFSLL